MSLAEHVSRPFPVFAKLAVMLRNIPAVQFVLAKCAALLRTDKAISAPLERQLLEESPVIAPDIVEPSALVELPVDIVAGAPAPNDLCERQQPLERRLLEEASGIAPDAFDPPAIVAELPANVLVAEPEVDPQSEREALIRRRWAETGSKMWNPDFNGAGGAVLNIQGSIVLLPAKPGGNLPRYDTLEFRRVGDQIVCEGVVLDPPKRRR